MQKKTPDYDNVFKTMKSKHKRMFIPVINDIFGKDYPMVRLHREGELLDGEIIDLMGFVNTIITNITNGNKNEERAQEVR